MPDSTPLRPGDPCPRPGCHGHLEIERHLGGCTCVPWSEPCAVCAGADLLAEGVDPARAGTSPRPLLVCGVCGWMAGVDPVSSGRPDADDAAWAEGMPSLQGSVSPDLDLDFDEGEEDITTFGAVLDGLLAREGVSVRVTSAAARVVLAVEDETLRGPVRHLAGLLHGLATRRPRDASIDEDWPEIPHPLRDPRDSEWLKNWSHSRSKESREHVWYISNRISHRVGVPADERAGVILLDELVRSGGELRPAWRRTRERLAEGGDDGA